MSGPVEHLDAPAQLGWRAAVGAACACAVLGPLVGIAAGGLPPAVTAIALFVAILSASLLLSWAADAAEVDVSGGLVIAGITFVTVLPELTIEVHYAFTQQTSLVSANLTGATRLLLTAAVAMPLLAVWLLGRRGDDPGSFALPPARRVDLAILFVGA